MPTATQGTPMREWSDGFVVDTVLLVREVDRRRKRDGSPFLRLTLADRSGTVPAVLWDNENGDAPQPGAAVQVTGRFATNSRYGRQLTLATVRPVLASAVDWKTLLDGPATPPAALENHLDELIA